MSKHRVVKSDFWVDKYIEGLQIKERYLFLYFLTNPNTNILGIYQSTLKRICFETDLDTDTVESILHKFKTDDKIHYIDDYVIMVNFQKHQVPNKTMKTGIEKLLMSLPKNVISFICSSKSVISDRLSYYIKAYTYLHKDKDISKDIDININKDKNEISGHEEMKINPLEFLKDGTIQPQVYFQENPHPELDDDAEEIIKKIIITKNPKSKLEPDAYQISIIKKHLLIYPDQKEILFKSIERAEAGDKIKGNAFEVPNLTVDYITSPKNQSRLIGYLETYESKSKNNQTSTVRSYSVEG